MWRAPRNGRPPHQPTGAPAITIYPCYVCARATEPSDESKRLPFAARVKERNPVGWSRACHIKLKESSALPSVLTPFSSLGCLFWLVRPMRRNPRRPRRERSSATTALDGKRLQAAPAQRRASKPVPLAVVRDRARPAQRPIQVSVERV